MKKMDKLNLAIIEGTTRPSRLSIHAAKLILQVANKYDDLQATLVDPLDFNFPLDGNDDSERDPKFTQITKKAEAFFLVIPEYNHSFPGSLKLLLDSELNNYIHKPVAFAGVSKGPWGGTRGIQSMVPVVRELGLVATFTDVHFPFVSKLFDDQGNLQEKDYIKRVKKSLDELIWMAKTLKHGRESLSN